MRLAKSPSDLEGEQHNNGDLLILEPLTDVAAVISIFSLYCFLSKSQESQLII